MQRAAAGHLGRTGTAAAAGGRRAPRRRALLLAIALTACRTVAPLPDVPPAPVDGRPPKVALVLGGGGARGFAHVGVIRVLEDAGIPVELIVGASVGSLIGALYAGPTNSRVLERTARDLEREDLFDFALAPALFGTGLASGDRLERFVRKHLEVGRIEELRIPYAAVATDLDTGEMVVLRSGDVARAVRASSAIPGVFEPVELDERLLVDGAVSNNLPVQVARDMGADVVIAVDVTAVDSRARPPANFVEVILRAVNLVVHAGAEEARADADVLLAPEVGRVGFIDFDRKDEAIAAGSEAARVALPGIRSIVEAWGEPAAAPGAARRGGTP
jgi:NTE family protein